jgi:hypothetical protein
VGGGKRLRRKKKENKRVREVGRKRRVEGKRRKM